MTGNAVSSHQQRTIDSLVDLLTLISSESLNYNYHTLIRQRAYQNPQDFSRLTTAIAIC